MHSNILTISLFLFCLIIYCQAKCTYHGPFLIWGQSVSQKSDYNVLTGFKEHILRNHYLSSEKVIVFIKKTNLKLNKANFPHLYNIIQGDNFIFSSQDQLPLDPNDFNKDVLEVNLDGTPHQQDAQISDTYRTAQKSTENQSILYILASKSINCHVIKRRQTKNETIIENLILYDSGKIKFFSKEPPTLTIKGQSVILSKHLVPTTRESPKNNTLQLDIKFLDPTKNSQKLTIRINYVTRNSYWFLTSAEVSDDFRNFSLLNVVGNQPNAPINKSVTCRNTLEFRDKNNSTVLTFKNGYQMQPWIIKGEKFDESFDCNGYFTAPIWSGILVTLLLGFVLSIVLAMLVDIRIYDIQNKSSKQLVSFTAE